MAVSQVQLLNQSFNNSQITANGTYDLYVGPEMSNNNNLPSLRAAVDFSNFVPLDGGAINPKYSITALFESIQSGVWFPIAYQFTPYRGNGSGNQRIIILQPNIDTFNLGIDDAIYVADQTIALVSRQQGKLGPSYRLRVVLRETGYGTPEAFQSGTIKVVAELHDAS